MNAHSLELQLEMLLNRSSNEGYQSPYDEDVVPIAGGMGEPLSRGASGAMRWAFALIMLGLGIIVAVILVLASSGPTGIQPETWTHAIFALVAGEVLIVVAAMIKTMSTVDRSQELIQKFLRAQSRRSAPPRARTLDLMAAPTLRMPTAVGGVPELKTAGGGSVPAGDTLQRKLVRGQIGNRTFEVHPDGMVEVETLLGRRKFSSIDAAQAFVGGEVVCQSDAEPAPQVAA